MLSERQRPAGEREGPSLPADSKAGETENHNQPGREPLWGSGAPSQPPTSVLGPLFLPCRAGNVHQSLGTFPRTQGKWQGQSCDSSCLFPNSGLLMLELRMGEDPFLGMPVTLTLNVTLEPLG